jgi:hypothetical protein
MSTSQSHEFDNTVIPDNDLTLPRPVTAQESTQKNTCPHCNSPYTVGELTCSHCGILFVSGGKTNKLDALKVHSAEATKPPIGAVCAEADRPIYLAINGQRIALPIQNSVVIGRCSNDPDTPQPDVALNDFGAEVKGVSRHHVRITRHADIFYVADMGSSNGAFLNGRPLLRNHNRVIRDGDELQLGILKLTIHF